MSSVVLYFLLSFSSFIHHLELLSTKYYLIISVCKAACPSVLFLSTTNIEISWTVVKGLNILDVN